MENDHVIAEMLQRVEDHQRSAILVIASKRRSNRQATRCLEMALADELRTRTNLIRWQAPTPTLAIKKLLHLLAHALAAELAFDDQSLAEIRAETQRLERNQYASIRHGN